MADDDEIILSELSDDELVLQMHDDLYDGLKEEIEEGVNILIERGWAPYDVLTKALVAGMTIVGADAYCRDAAVAVETAKQFVARKHNQLNG